MSNVKILKLAAVVAGVIMIGVLLGWLGSRSSPGARSNPQAGPAGETTSANPTPVAVPSDTTPKISSPQPVKASAELSITNPVPPGTNLISDWEDRVDTILGSEGEEADKAKQMLEMFPRLPEDGQAEVAQHLANLTSDQDFAGLGKYLTNSTMPETVLDVLMADLLNRPNNLKLPLLVDIARDSQNPKAAEAKDLLELFLEEDYGNDWPTWQTKVDQWLKDNPD